MEDKEKKNYRILLARIGIIAGTVLVLLFLTVYFGLMIFCLGPSPNAGRQFALSVRETSALKFLAGWYYSEEEIAAFSETDTAEAEDFDLASVKPAAEPKKKQDVISLEKKKEGETCDPDIFIYDVKGATYNGKIMLITDPKRVYVGTLPKFGREITGKTLADFCKDDNAVAGTNAGGFYDLYGKGNGGEPDGLVIRDGKVVWGGGNVHYNGVVGFDANGKMIVGNMSGNEAIALGVVTGVCFDGGPILIKNGAPTGNALARSGSLNPRTAIGQREDGTVLLLVVSGRSVDSLGATFADLINIMLEYGAVNACNLDGGSSSSMLFFGESMTESSSIVGDRELPDAILVKARDNG